ncbi:MAG: hypothetical protein R6U56_11040 [Opitutales bacterium]
MNISGFKVRFVAIASITLFLAIVSRLEANREIRLEGTRVSFDVEPGEHALVSRLSGGRAVIIDGVKFQDYAANDFFSFYIEIAFRAEKNKSERWLASWGVEGAGSDVWLGSSMNEVDGESLLKLSVIRLPVKGSVVDAYLMPYRRYGNDTESLIVMFSPNKNALRDCFTMAPGKSFSWKESFSVLEDNLPERNGEVSKD